MVILYPLYSARSGTDRCIVGTEAPVHGSKAGTRDTWNRGFDLSHSPTYSFGGVGISCPPGRHRCRPCSCRLTYSLLFGCYWSTTSAGSVAKLPLGGKIRKWDLEKSMTWEPQLSCFR